jgi:hypothetical protein
MARGYSRRSRRRLTRSTIAVMPEDVRVSRIIDGQLSMIDLMIVDGLSRGLASMKRLAGRPQDLVDLDNLGLERDEGAR